MWVNGNVEGNDSIEVVIMDIAFFLHRQRSAFRELYPIDDEVCGTEGSKVGVLLPPRGLETVVAVLPPAKRILILHKIYKTKKNFLNPENLRI